MKRESCSTSCTTAAIFPGMQRAGVAWLWTLFTNRIAIRRIYPAHWSPRKPQSFCFPNMSFYPLNLWNQIFLKALLKPRSQTQKDTSINPRIFPVLWLRHKTKFCIWVVFSFGSPIVFEWYPKIRWHQLSLMKKGRRDRCLDDGRTFIVIYQNHPFHLSKV